MTKGLVTILLLLGNGVFVGGEFALIASRRTALEPLAATSKRARWALSARSQIPLMIAGAQLGSTYGRRIPDEVLRWVVVAIGTVVAIVLIVD